MLRKHGTIKILFLSCFLMGIRILLPIRSGIIGIVLAQLLQGVTYMTIPNWEVTDNFLETGEIDYREIDERVKKYGRGIEYV